MKRLIFIIFLFTSFGAESKLSSDTMSLFSIKDIVYHSEFEKKVFDCLESEKKCDLMLLAMATNPDMELTISETYRKDFYRFLDELKNDKKISRKPKTQIRFIFNAIHEKYLKLYRENTLFSEIFTHGHFNCLTASLLYAFAFEYFDIPYSVNLIPNHVYVLAYPNQSSIIVETTNPLKGARIFVDSREKARAVQQLVDMKIITQNEILEKGIDRIFNETYLSQETPDLKQLIGSLYHNIAIEEGEKLNIHASYENFKKSSYLFPKRLTNMMILNYAAVIIAQNDYVNKNSYRVLTEMEKFLIYNLPAKSLVDQGVSFMNQSISNRDYQLMDSAYNWLYDGFTDEFIKNEIKFAYNYNKAILLSSDFKIDEAIHHAGTAFDVKPENSNINNLLLELMLSSISSSKTILDNYNQVLRFSAQFEKINQNKRFIFYHQMVILDMMNQEFINGNFSQGEKYRNEFENNFAPESIEFPDASRYIEEIYSRASLYYFRVNRRNQARDVLTSGMKYLPNSYELQSKLNALR
jgi:hypothetical protein